MSLPGPFHQDITQAKADYGTPIAFTVAGQGPITFAVYQGDGGFGSSVAAQVNGSFDNTIFDSNAEFQQSTSLGTATPKFSGPGGVFVNQFPYFEVTFSNAGDGTETEATLKVWQPF